MTKKKIHHRVIHHGIHQGIPFGTGTGIGIFGIIAYATDKISELTGDAETIQACMNIIQSVFQ